MSTINPVMAPMPTTGIENQNQISACIFDPALEFGKRCSRNFAFYIHFVVSRLFVFLS